MIEVEAEAQDYTVKICTKVFDVSLLFVSFEHLNYKNGKYVLQSMSQEDFTRSMV